MNRRARILTSLAIPAALLLGAALVAPSSAVSPIAVEPVTLRSDLPDYVAGQLRIRQANGSIKTINMPDLDKVVTAKITVQPGAQFPWHTHSGPVLVTIVQGELIYISSMGCSESKYVAGQAFVDSGHGHTHSAVNRTDGETIFYATFLEVPASGPLTITEGITAPDCGCPAKNGLPRPSTIGCR
jgi:quercetin dioxygenase-like cupin family protein